MVVSSGKILGTEIRHNEALVMFFLRNRLPHRYGRTELRPGHPDYDRLRAEIQAELIAEQREAYDPKQRLDELTEWMMGFKKRWRLDWEMEQKAKDAFG